ncbi:DegT/DnrJ/EryC1/StrS family aminotransferase [Albidovulum sediminicola]|uniref:DegT/DnrJ/EryC1/StrS family aminotransferase n=1 Tax=Albidovulum sediminicola TaxID=2984331 RepID=A0ABT2Z1I0_9RHOB|nr:DegT/DnrJ/EryC1/StrS family aminotransferase [Defluviimonas sp. WL0075]MCV2864998.1 DegT/DnrJ/EryC1/StrS family aminotransferase [Defluviimonas sp. WL0075]
MKYARPIYVTRPVLPDLPDFLSLLEDIWSTRILSNNGPMLRRFEAALGEYLGVEHISIVNNASMALVLSLRHFGITGEVITTPFSFVATSHAIRWAGAEPVFADVDPVTLNVDPAAVEARITPRTQAILAVHCYGQPCDTDALGDIARRHGLRLIYDAAHAFAVRHDGQPLVAVGDLSVLSFHATKVFNSCEGGAIICPDAATKDAIDLMGNFGIVDETTVTSVGLNSKMSELNAAFGLALLPRMDAALDARKVVASRYWARLKDLPGITCLCDPAIPGRNAYAFPILVSPDYPLSRDGLYERLRDEGIFARRYFYPPIADLPMYCELPSASAGELPRARRAAREILCLPLYPDLAEADQDRIIGLVSAP